MTAFAPFPGFDPCDGAEPCVALARDNPCAAPARAAPIAIYMPRAHAVLVRLGNSAIEMSEARIGEFVAFLRRWPLAPSATITIGNETGRLTIAPGHADAVANAIVMALATRDLALDLSEAA